MYIQWCAKGKQNKIKQTKTLLEKLLEINNKGKKITSGINQFFLESAYKEQTEANWLFSFIPRISVGVRIRSIENFRVLSYDFTVFISTLLS